MLAYTLKRSVVAFFILIVVSALTFSLSHLSADPAMTIAGETASEEDIEALITNRPAGSAPMVFKEIPAGAATSVWAATAPELEGVGGQYALDCHLVDASNTEAGTDSWAAWAEFSGMKMF